VNRFSGGGGAVYFGAAGCAELTGVFLRDLLGELGIKTLELPEKVFITERKSGEASFVFIINLGEEARDLDPGIRGIDLLSGREINGPFRAEALEIYLVEKEHGHSEKD
jgi:beta-galactosidase GanA